MGRLNIARRSGRLPGACNLGRTLGSAGNIGTIIVFVD